MGLQKYTSALMCSVFYLVTLVENDPEPLSPEQGSVHLLLELGHQRSVGGQHDVLVLKLQRDQGLRLAVVNENVEIDAEIKLKLIIMFLLKP